MTPFRIRHYLRTALWVIPVACVLAGVLLSFLTTTLDGGDLLSLTFTGGPDAALAILGAIAASMVTLTGLVLTIVLVVVQLAMGQFSPRIVRTILRDRPSQLAIGIFAATFAHALLAMRDIASTEPGEPVPGLAVVVAFALVVVSIMVLIAYVHHVGLTLRVASLVESIGQETREVLDQLYGPAEPDPAAERGEVVYAPHSGVLFHVDSDRAVAAAAAAGCRLDLLQALGDYVPAGSPIFRVVGASGDLRHADALKAISLGPERTMNRDAAYGFRMLVDITLRSLSDSNDDPTTAVAAIDRLHDLLRQLVSRRFPDGEFADSSGVVRLRVPVLSWEGYLTLAFDEIRQAAARIGSTQVIRRLADALEDLRDVAPAERRAAVEQQIRLLHEDVQHDQRHVDGFLDADRQGLGSAPALRLDSIATAGNASEDGNPNIRV